MGRVTITIPKIHKNKVVVLLSPQYFKINHQKIVIKIKRNIQKGLCTLSEGGVPIGLSIKKTLQIDVINRTEKTYLLNNLVQPHVVYRCI